MYRSTDRYSSHQNKSLRLLNHKGCVAFFSPSHYAQQYTNRLGGAQHGRDVWEGYNLNAEELAALKDTIATQKGKHAAVRHVICCTLTV
jgi:hypothetical protein